jgi:hypothetical protein
MGDFPLITKSVMLNNFELNLRGLSLPHVFGLLKEMEEPLNRLYQAALSGRIEADVGSVASEMGEDFSKFVGLVLGYAAGRLDKQDYFANEMPMGSQIEALQIVLDLTITNAGGAEKLMEIIVRGLQRLNQFRKPPQL